MLIAMDPRIIVHGFKLSYIILLVMFATLDELEICFCSYKEMLSTF